MIYQSQHLKPAQRNHILNFINIRPVPQLKVWENCASQFLAKNMLLEACVIMDLMASHYGKQMGMLVSERVLKVPTNKTGRGITSSCSELAHPAYYQLRDRITPLKLGDWIVLRAGGNILLSAPDRHEQHLVHALADEPTQAPVIPSPADRMHVQWMMHEDCLIYTNGTDTLNIVDLSGLDFSLSAEEAQKKVLPKATLKFDSKIKNICGPLRDGTFFLTCEPPLPVFSDVCRLCALDIPKLRAAFAESLCCDVREIGALKKEILLTNVEQTLKGDCCVNGEYFMTCGGGMQNREVRFIGADGGWTTKFVHEAPVIRIIPSECGPVSLDAQGTAILWNELRPVDDAVFQLKEVQNDFQEHWEETDFTVDWTHKRLYLTLTTPPQALLAPTLSATRACSLEGESAKFKSFVLKIYHLENTTLVLLSDGSIHIWDLSLDCVNPRWQLSKTYAEASDWFEVLNQRSPAIELDPRIRMVELGS